MSEIRKFVYTSLYKLWISRCKTQPFGGQQLSFLLKTLGKINIFHLYTLVYTNPLTQLVKNVILTYVEVLSTIQSLLPEAYISQKLQHGKEPAKLADKDLPLLKTNRKNESWAFTSRLKNANRQIPTTSRVTLNYINLPFAPVDPRANTPKRFGDSTLQVYCHLSSYDGGKLA